MSLKQIVTSFRKGILNGRSSELMCMAVCLPLQGYLSMLGYNTKLVEADFESPYGSVNHVWLEMDDETIIDPTADQFSGKWMKLPKVYIGKIPEVYKRWMTKPTSDPVTPLTPTTNP